MSVRSKPDVPTTSPFPGAGRSHVPQPGQFVPTTPGQPPTRSTAQAIGPLVAPEPGPMRPTSYVDPLLFSEGVFQSQADYDQTVRLATAKIRSGEIQPREPDLDEKRSTVKVQKVARPKWQVGDPGTEPTRLQHAITSLKPEQRQVIELLYFDELSQAEVAEKLHLPLATVKSRARVALKRLILLIK